MSSTCTQQQPLLVVTDTPIIKATMPVIPPRVRIIYEDYDDVSVQYELKAFSLKDFDYFVRQRFQIEEGTALKYSQDLEGKCVFFLLWFVYCFRPLACLVAFWKHLHWM